MNGFKQRTPRQQQPGPVLWPAYLVLGIAIVAFIWSVAYGWFPSPQQAETGASPAAEARQIAVPWEPQQGAGYVRAEPSAPRGDELAPHGPSRPSAAVGRDAPDNSASPVPNGGRGLANALPPQRSYPPYSDAAAPPELAVFDPRRFHGSGVVPSSYSGDPALAAPVVFADTPSLPQPPTEPRQALPPPPGQYHVPVFRQPAEDAVDFKIKDGRISLVVRNTPLSHVVSLLAQAQGFNVVCAQDISASVSIVLHDVAWHEALTAVLSTAGYTWVHTNNIIRITDVSAGKNLAPDVQGRVLQVFPLNYASGMDVERSIRGLLSPAGQVFLAESSATDSRKPKDVVVVEDLPQFMTRIANYVDTVDRPPRQVLIEAHVLEVKLAEDSVRGIDFKHLFSILNNNVELQLSGMTTPLPTPPAVPTAFMARVGGGNLTAVIEFLTTTHHAKTLAAPRVLVVDGQEANIQVGEQLGYLVKTTTETSTVQDVQFLNTGVILNVTPHIAQDGRVLMSVKPKVSTGHINAKDLPEEKTSEVHSQVLLNDGQGIIIGGLIQEKDSSEVQKVPVLGDLWLVGALFQRRRIDRHRTEIVIALVPYVQPLDGCMSERDHTDMLRCQTPLLSGCLTPVPRPWEPAPVDPIRMPGVLGSFGQPETLSSAAYAPQAVPSSANHAVPLKPPLPREHVMPSPRLEEAPPDHRIPPLSVSDPMSVPRRATSQYRPPDWHHADGMPPVVRLPSTSSATTGALP